MSAEARPISPGRFAQAIEDLPAENIYSKAQEIQNSISHLQRSNAQLQEYSDSIKGDATLDADIRAEGDRDCLEAIRENQVVIERQIARIDLLKAEVERRGARWHEATVQTNGTSGEPEASDVAGPNSSTTATVRTRPGLSDEELRRQLEQQLSDDGDEEEGMHL